MPASAQAAANPAASPGRRRARRPNRRVPTRRTSGRFAGRVRLRAADGDDDIAGVVVLKTGVSRTALYSFMSTRWSQAETLACISARIWSVPWVTCGFQGKPIADSGRIEAIAVWSVTRGFRIGTKTAG